MKHREFTLDCGEGISFVVKMNGASEVSIDSIFAVLKDLQATLTKVRAIWACDFERRVKAEVEARLAAHQGIYR